MREDRIEHGTARGWRQHRRRLSPTCDPCRDAKHIEDENRAEARAARPARTVGPVSAARNLCPTPDCGTPAAGRPLPDGWSAATIGSQRQRRRFCSTWCATYAEALHDIRSIETRSA